MGEISNVPRLSQRPSLQAMVQVRAFVLLLLGVGCVGDEESDNFRRLQDARPSTGIDQEYREAPMAATKGVDGWRNGHWGTKQRRLQDARPSTGIDQEYREAPMAATKGVDGWRN